MKEFVQGGWYHWRDGWYFKRLPGGFVSVELWTETKAALVTCKIPPSEWASIVAAVTPHGSTGDAYLSALAVHDGRQPPDETVQMKEMIRFLVDELENRDGYSPAEASCPECTVGTVPDSKNKGPCLYHQALELIEQGEYRR